MTDIDDQFVPEESEQLDQLELERTMDNREVDDALDEGYTAPDDWSAAEGFGNTATEMRQGETLEQRIQQEIPEPDPLAEEEATAEHLDDNEVGAQRAGRLVQTDEDLLGIDREPQLVGEDVGVDSGDASAEEAAMHIIEDHPTPTHDG